MDIMFTMPDGSVADPGDWLAAIEADDRNPAGACLRASLPSDSDPP